MKYKLKLVCVFLLVLMSLTMLGCFKPGEKTIVDSIKSKSKKDLETVEYIYNERNHVARIRIKDKNSKKPYDSTLYYNVLTDDDVVNIHPYQIPKDFVDFLYTEYPDTFLEDLKTYEYLEELLPNVSYAIDVLNSKIIRAKTPAEWDVIPDYAILADVVIDIYKKAYENAPSYIADEFPKPPASPLPYSWSDPSDYIDYSSNDLAEWGYAVRTRSSKSK